MTKHCNVIEFPSLSGDKTPSKENANTEPIELYVDSAVSIWAAAVTLGEVELAYHLRGKVLASLRNNDTTVPVDNTRFLPRIHEMADDMLWTLGWKNDWGNDEDDEDEDQSDEDEEDD